MDMFDDGDLILTVFKDKVEDFIFLAESEKAILHAKFKITVNAETVDIGKMERALVVNKREIHVTKMPEKEMRLEMEVGTVLRRELREFNVTFYGYEGMDRKEIESFNIIPEDDTPNININIILKKNKLAPYKLFNFQI